MELFSSTLEHRWKNELDNVAQRNLCQTRVLGRRWLYTHPFPPGTPVDFPKVPGGLQEFCGALDVFSPRYFESSLVSISNDNNDKI